MTYILYFAFEPAKVTYLNIKITFILIKENHKYKTKWKSIVMRNFPLTQF